LKTQLKYKKLPKTYKISIKIISMSRKILLNFKILTKLFDLVKVYKNLKLTVDC